MAYRKVSAEGIEKQIVPLPDSIREKKQGDSDGGCSLFRWRPTAREINENVSVIVVFY